MGFAAVPEKSYNNLTPTMINQHLTSGQSDGKLTSEDANTPSATSVAEPDYNERFETRANSLRNLYQNLSAIEDYYYLSDSDFQTEAERRKWEDWRRSVNISEVHDSKANVLSERLRLAQDTERLKIINPNFDTGLEAYTNNCQRCVVAQEINARGHRVRAKAYDASDPIGNNGIAVWNLSTTPWSRDPFVKLTNKDDFWDDAKQAFAEWGDGARAIVRVEWNNGRGHFFSAERVGNTIVYTDLQSATVRDILDTLSLCTGKSNRLWLMRVDNRDLNNLAQYAVEAIS